MSTYAPNMSESRLRAIMPRLSLEKAVLYLSPLVAAMNEFDITSRVRAAAFLATLAHESGELRRWIESMNYSADGMRATWPSRFRGEVGKRRAAALHRKPRAIAEYVYGGRMGNGPEGSGDGWNYRGRGPIMITGAKAYLRAGEDLDSPLVEHPELVAEDPAVGFRVAGLVWGGGGLWWNNLNGAADADTEAAFLTTQRAINIGNPKSTRMPIHWTERLEYWRRAREVLA